MSRLENFEEASKKRAFVLPETACGCGGSCSTAKKQEHNQHVHDHHEHDHDHDHHEFEGIALKIYLFRLLSALVLMFVLMFTSFVQDFISGVLNISSEKTAENILFLVYVFAYLLAGFEVVYHAFTNILKAKFLDENFLMTIASIGAFVIGERNEALGVMIFYGIGEYLQSLAVSHSRKNIEDLMDICPEIAHLKTLDGIVDVAPEKVAVGERLIVKVGEKIPLDSIVLEGDSFVDTMALTGESVPVRVSKGSQLLSGSINTHALLEVKVLKTFDNSTVAKILNLVQHAAAKKARSEKFITKFAKYYTPIVVFLALLVAFVPPLFSDVPFENWLYRALTFLIISCPCALVLSIPITFFGGIGASARAGILVKGGNYLEALQEVKTLVVDKTGTLTKGVFTVQKVAGIGVSSEELLALAASVEANSNHPIAQSISKAYSGALQECLQIQEKAGKGIIAHIGAKDDYDVVVLGNKALLKDFDIEVDEDFKQTAIYMAKNNVYIGYILISDELKDNVKQALENAKKAGIEKIIMLTGDNKSIAHLIADELGIDEVHAELLAHEKVYELEKIMQERNYEKARTAFVGDGINDAPVLSRADIGIAMGGIGSDAAIEAADIVLMNDDLEKVATGLKIAKKTRQIVIQNIIFALGVKGIIMLLALYGITSIWFAIFADVGVALIAIANAMRAMLVK